MDVMSGSRIRVARAPENPQWERMNRSTGVCGRAACPIGGRRRYQSFYSDNPASHPEHARVLAWKLWRVRPRFRSRTRGVVRTRPACPYPQSLAQQGFRNSVLTATVQSFGDAGPTGERFSVGRAGTSPELRAKTPVVPGLLSPSHGSREGCAGACWRRERNRDRTFSTSKVHNEVLGPSRRPEQCRARRLCVVVPTSRR
jgi:hypothetical protein